VVYLQPGTRPKAVVAYIPFMPGMLGVPSHDCGTFHGKSESVDVQPLAIRHTIHRMRKKPALNENLEKII
jgi:hypothetical protein